MPTEKTKLLLIFATVFIHLVGFGIVIPVLPLYAERFGASPLVIGLLVSSYSLMQAIFAPLLGRLSDRVGRRPVLLISMAGTAAGLLLMGWAKALPLLFAGRIIDGMTGGSISTAQAYIADITPPERRSRGMGLIGAAFGLGFIFGPAIGGLLSRYSLAAPLFFAAGLAAVNTVLVWIFLPESLPAGVSAPSTGTGHCVTPKEKKAPLAALFRESEGGALQSAMGAYFFTTVGFSLMTATYPLFAERRFGYSPPEIGAIFAGVGLLGAIIQGGLMGWLERSFGEKRLAVAGTLMLAGSFFALPLSTTASVLLLATALSAMGHSLLATPLNAVASKSVGSHSQGRALGLMQSAASMARIVGPVAGGWLLNYDAAHPAVPFGRTPYWAASGVMGAALVLALCLRVQRDGC